MSGTSVASNLPESVGISAFWFGGKLECVQAHPVQHKYCSPLFCFVPLNILLLLGLKIQILHRLVLLAALSSTLVPVYWLYVLLVPRMY